MSDRVEPRIVEVRGGRVVPTGSWLYVWIDLAQRAVVHVGGTAFDPELRTHVHLTDDDPARGRVKAQLPHAADGDFDVLAFRLPASADRASAKTALIAALDDIDRPSGDEVIDGIVRSVRRHLA
jgi:hypothetical protein